MLHNIKVFGSVATCRTRPGGLPVFQSTSPDVNLSKTTMGGCLKGKQIPRFTGQSPIQGIEYGSDHVIILGESSVHRPWLSSLNKMII